MSRDRLTLVTVRSVSEERIDLLQRWMKFHRRSFRHAVVIDAPGETIARAGSIPAPADSGYRSTRCESEATRVFPRLAAGMDLVDTPFVSIVGDDDFLMPRFASRAVKLLERVPEVTAVDGYSLRFSERSGRLRCQNGSLQVASYSRSRFGLRSTRGRFQDESEHFNPGIIGGVWRTEIARAIVNVIENLPLLWTDVLFVGLGLLSGDFVRSAELAQLRSTGPRMANSSVDKGGQDAAPRNELSDWSDRQGGLRSLATQFLELAGDSSVCEYTDLEALVEFVVAVSTSTGAQSVVRGESCRNLWTSVLSPESFIDTWRAMMPIARSFATAEFARRAPSIH